MCFHCGDKFTNVGTAREHFGGEMYSLTGCQIKFGAERGILMALRKAEDELARYRDDDTVAYRELATMQGRHSDALRDAEELGYERGLRDGRKMETADAAD